ncbi:MAG: hypothetical protein GC206_07290 [Alphaproteobacteria bacterium]|nr:hypothetical protein [Alphaproteobacteria bacterium]
MGGFKIRIWHVAFFVTALIVFAIARAPASLIVPSRADGLAYARTEGTIWNGRFIDARINGVDAGDIAYTVSLFNLVRGLLDVDFDMEGGALRGESLTLKADWRGDRRLIAPTLALEGAQVTDGLTLVGATRIEGLDLYFSDGRCVTAVGRLSSDVLARSGALLGWQGPQLTGEASCRDAAAQLTLIGSSAEGDTVQSILELAPSGEGLWRAFVSTQKPTLRAMLEQQGFRTFEGGPNVALSKDFRWLPMPS